MAHSIQIGFGGPLSLTVVYLEIKRPGREAYYLFFYGSTALYGPGPPRFVEVSWSHTFETHHSR
jgi:hypothetical protein